MLCAVRACRLATTTALQLRTMSAIHTVNTDKAPAAIGPYSQAKVANGFVFCSGCIPINPANQQVELGSIQEQTNLVISNMEGVLGAAGCSLADIVKTTVFLKDMNDFVAFNEVYAKRFGDSKPARSTVQVARLPKDVSVEIECVAVQPK